MKQPSSSSRRRLGFALVLGAVLSLGLFAVGAELDASRMQARDAAAEVAAVGALRTQLEAFETQVSDLAGLYVASREVTEREFGAFSGAMLKRSSANAFVILEPVTDAQRPEFERRLGRPLREFAPDGSLRTATRRGRYLVVAREQFAHHDESVLGVDVLTEPGRRAAILRAQRNGGVGSTMPVRLAHTDQLGLVVFAAVEHSARVASGAFTFRVLADAVAAALVNGTSVSIAAGATRVNRGEHEPRGNGQTLDFYGQTFRVRASAPTAGHLRSAPLGLIAGLVLTLLLWIASGRRRVRRLLERGEVRFADAFEASPIGQALATDDGRFARVNAALSAITGLTAESLCTTTVVELVQAEDRDRVRALIAEAIAQHGRPVDAELRLQTPAAVTRWVHIHITHLRDPDSRQSLLMQIVDVSDQRGLETELRRQADHDSLTELLNRRGFQDRLHALLSGPSPHGALMLIDLDHFKAVNDTLGHHVGDRVIHATGQALRQSLRAHDVVARIGGDEFAVLLPDADREQAQQAADRLVAAIAAGSAVPGVTGLHTVTASIGFTMLDGAFESADAALVAADLAMYDAKAAGRRRSAVYDDCAGSGTHTRLGWVDRIRTALAEDRFVLVAQPICELATGRIVHHELLLRMLDADGGQLPPSAFVPVAEQFDLMDEIDRWVVSTAIDLLAAHPDQELVFEVNLSGSSLGSAELLQTISHKLAASRVRPQRIIFEITETAAVSTLSDAQRFANELSALGCRFALDDFGVGFGSFTYVKHLPFDFLKIDGEFVRHSATSPTDRVILESLIHAAQGLGKLTIAEYVEDAETLDLLRRLGVDMVQGFHVGRPVDVETLLGRARTSTPT